MQEYRSGHNEAVLKTVWGKPHGGSNPSSCATQQGTPNEGVPCSVKRKGVAHLQLPFKTHQLCWWQIALASSLPFAIQKKLLCAKVYVKTKAILFEKEKIKLRWKKDRVELLVQSSNHWLMGMQRSE